MTYLIKDLRRQTGLTQQAFAELYRIPVKTLQHWESGYSLPAPYLVSLIAKTIPAKMEELEVIPFQDERYYYCETRRCFYSAEGESVRIPTDLQNVNRKNLGIFLHDYFNEQRILKERLENDIALDKETDFSWERR